MTPLEKRIADELEKTGLWHGLSWEDHIRQTAKAIALLFTEEKEKLAVLMGLGKIVGHDGFDDADGAFNRGLEVAATLIRSKSLT